MKRSSLVKLLFFSLALYANVRYALFLLNPIHIGNLPFYIVTALADLISLVTLTFIWLSSLHFELMKDRYYHEIRELQTRGRELVNSKVSILIPVVNEKFEIVKETLEAAKNIQGNKRIFLLDDGKRDELKELAQKMKIEYLRRGDRSHFKSGNLNHGLKHVNSDFVAVFDSDFIAKKNFLTETLPLFTEESVGAVQTPQVYYNKENLFSKGMKNFQKVFYEYTMPSKHLLGSAFCVGTNVVYRKSALDAIGGIPLIDHSEDVFTALKMAEHGYTVTYLNKELAFGLSPDNIISFFNQQFRWARGGLTMLFRHNTLFNMKLTLDQRIEYFFSNMFYLTGISILVYLFSPIAAILFNVKPINEAFFIEWLTAYSLFFIFNFAFYTLIVRKYRLQSMALGIFCFVPYVSALISIFTGRGFTWKPTNFLSGDVVARLIALLISYLFVTAIIVYLFLAKILVFRTSIAWYLFWMVINSFLIIYFVVGSYKSVFFSKPK